MSAKADVTEPIVMIRPRPLAFKAGIESRMIRNTAATFTAMTRSKYASSCPSSAWKAEIPAHGTTMSRPPKASIASATIAAFTPGSVTSSSGHGFGFRWQNSRKSNAQSRGSTGEAAVLGYSEEGEQIVEVLARHGVERVAHGF